MTREDIENNVGYWQEKANLEYVNQCLERGVTDFTEIDRAFDAGFDKGYQYAIEKIFKCIEDQAIFGWIEDIEVDKFLEKIRKAMED